MSKLKTRMGWRDYGSKAERVFSMDLGSRGVRFIAQRDYKVLQNRDPRLGRIFVDFYLPDLKLIVEIDGRQHSRLPQSEIDLWRDEVLGGMGYEVKRFSCRDIYDETAIAAIDRLLKSSLNPLLPVRVG